MIWTRKLQRMSLVLLLGWGWTGFVHPAAALEGSPDHGFKEGTFSVVNKGGTMIVCADQLEALLCNPTVSTKIGQPGWLLPGDGSGPLPDEIEPCLSNIGTATNGDDVGFDELGPHGRELLFRMTSGGLFGGGSMTDVKVQPQRMCSKGPEPVQTSCGAWDVSVTLDPELEQPESVLRVYRDGDDQGGVYVGGIATDVAVRFTSQDTGEVETVATRWVLEGFGHWAPAPARGSEVPELIPVDADCDGVAEEEAASSNFAPGWGIDASGQTVPSVDCLVDLASGSTQCTSGVVVTEPGTAGMHLQTTGGRSTER